MHPSLSMPGCRGRPEESMHAEQRRTMIRFCTSQLAPLGPVADGYRHACGGRRYLSRPRAHSGFFPSWVPGAFPRANVRNGSEAVPHIGPALRRSGKCSGSQPVAPLEMCGRHREGWHHPRQYSCRRHPTRGGCRIRPRRPAPGVAGGQRFRGDAGRRAIFPPSGLHAHGVETARCGSDYFGRPELRDDRDLRFPDLRRSRSGNVPGRSIGCSLLHGDSRIFIGGLDVYPAAVEGARHQ
jgi:hypothetical protein